MILIKCHIENFGKLQNYDYVFKNGLNTIREENGFGKTTFADFIKAMFYGLDSKKSENTDRKKYIPWQGGNFGGNIEFKVKNKKYRIERSFGKKASEDVFTLYDLDTGLESNDYTSNIGEEIFKINKEAYERSTYIPQGKVKIETNDSINAKLGNVLEGENDINTSEEAINKIDEVMKVYKKTGGRGIINEKIAKLNELKRLMENNKSDEEALQLKRKKLKETLQEIKEKENLKNEKQKILNGIIEKGRKDAKLETYNAIIKRLEESKRKNEELNNFFNGEIPQDEELDILLQKCLDVEKYKGEMNGISINIQESADLRKLNDRFNNKDISQEKIDKKISEYNEIHDIEAKIQNFDMEIQKLNLKIKEFENKIENNKMICIIFFIIFLILFFTKIILTVMKINSSIVLVILGIISIIISIFKYVSSKLKKSKCLKQKKLVDELEETKNSLKEKQKCIENEINEFIKIYSDTNKEKIIALTEIKTEHNRYKDIKENQLVQKAKNEETKAKLNLLEESIREYLKKFFYNVDIKSTSFSNLVNDLKIKKNEFNANLINIEEANRLKEEYEDKNDIEKLKDIQDMENANEEELSIQIQSLNEEIDRLNDEKNQNKNNIELLENKIDENAEIEVEAENLEQEIKEMQEKYLLLEKTKKYMEIAKERFSSHYLKGMIEEFKKTLNMLDNKNLDTNVDINLGVWIDANGSKKEIKYFSEGYKDLIYICVRFSLIKVLFENELPFVILDDPFVNLDDEKTKKALDLLRKLSEKYQIIYFICNKSRE